MYIHTHTGAYISIGKFYVTVHVSHYKREPRAPCQRMLSRIARALSIYASRISLTLSFLCVSVHNPTRRLLRRRGGVGDAAPFSIKHTPCRGCRKKWRPTRAKADTATAVARCIISLFRLSCPPGNRFSLF